MVEFNFTIDSETSKAIHKKLYDEAKPELDRLEKWRMESLENADRIFVRGGADV